MTWSIIIKGRREEEGEGEIFEIDVRFSLKDFRILPNEFDSELLTHLLLPPLEVVKDILICHPLFLSLDNKQVKGHRLGEDP